MSGFGSHTSGSRSHRHSDHRSKLVLRTFTFVLTPFLILTIVCCASMLILTKPYETVKPYLNFIFSSTQASETTGVRTMNKYRDDDAPIATRQIEDEETGETHTMIYPYYGDYYAVLNCEAAGMTDIPVYSGTSNDILALGAGWDNASVYIGNEGNVVIAGHNHTYFRNLPQCTIGDYVTLETDYIKITYQITDIEVFHEDDYTYVLPSDEDKLTMYTCWNNGKLGMSEYRLAVIASLVEREWKEVEQ